MPLDATLEPYLWRSLSRFLEAAVAPRILFAPGYAQAAEPGLEEWFAIWPMTVRPKGRPRGRLAGAALFQVSCFAKTREHRADAIADAPWILAGVARNALERKDVLILGPDGVSLLGVLTVGVADEEYLGENALEYSGREGVPDVPKFVHAVALTFSGAINSAP